MSKEQSAWNDPAVALVVSPGQPSEQNRVHRQTHNKFWQAFNRLEGVLLKLLSWLNTSFYFTILYLCLSLIKSNTSEIWYFEGFVKLKQIYGIYCGYSRFSLIMKDSNV